MTTGLSAPPLPHPFPPAVGRNRTPPVTTLPTLGPSTLRVAALTKRYGDLLAVDGLELEVRAGEILGFLGPNGAGKTTSLQMMCGLMAPDSGTVELDGRALKAGAARGLRELGVAPQEIVVWDTLTCLEQLEFIGCMYDLPRAAARQRALHLLEVFGLTDKAERLGRTLSGGMQRRLNIALGLVHEPRLLFLDEPQAGLDPQSRVLVRDYLRSLRGKMTVVITTHDMEEAEKLCDRVCIVDHGKRLVLDTVAALEAQVAGGDVVEVEIAPGAEGTLAEVARLAPAEAHGAGPRAPRRLEVRHRAARRGAAGARPPGRGGRRRALAQGHPRGRLHPPHRPEAARMRVLAYLRKTFLENLREWRILAFALVLAPGFVFMMAGYFQASAPAYGLLVLAQDSSAEARGLVEAFRSARHPDGKPYFDVTEVTDRQAARARLEKRDADLLVEIPAGFGQRLATFKAQRGGEAASLVNHADESNLRGSMAMALSDYVAFAYAGELTEAPMPLEPRVERVGQASAARSEFDLYVPALLVLSLIMVLFTAAASLIKEVDQRTMTRLQLSRLSTVELLAAISVNQVLIGVVALALAYGAALACGYRSSGSLGALLVLGAVTTLAVVAIAVLTAAFLRTIFELLTVGCFPFFVLMFFSECMFPLPKVRVGTLLGHAVHANDVLPTALCARAFGAILNQGAGLPDVAFELRGDPGAHRGLLRPRRRPLLAPAPAGGVARSGLEVPVLAHGPAEEPARLGPALLQHPAAHRQLQTRERRLELARDLRGCRRQRLVGRAQERLLLALRQQGEEEHHLPPGVGRVLQVSQLHRPLLQLPADPPQALLRQLGWLRRHLVGQLHLREERCEVVRRQDLALLEQRAVGRHRPARRRPGFLRPFTAKLDQPRHRPGPLGPGDDLQRAHAHPVDGVVALVQ
ncbi:MAG: ABC transporter ATP-binding protein/permease [Myxococcales bacterium]